MQDEFLTIAEAAETLRVSTKTLRRKMANRELSVLRDRRTALIPGSPLNAYIQRHTLTARTEPVAPAGTAEVAANRGPLGRRRVARLWEPGT